MDKISLFSRHSFASCVSEGYSFLVKQLPLVSRIMLPYYTVAALLATISFAYNTQINVKVIVWGSVSVTEMIASILVYTVAWVAATVALARMFLMFRRLTAMEMAQDRELKERNKKSGSAETFKRTMQLAQRALPYVIWPYLINMPGFPIMQPIMDAMAGMTITYQALFAVGMLVVFLVMAVFCTPLAYTFYCRMMKPVGLIADDKVMMEQLSFKKAYRKAFRYKWKTFTLMLWSSFLWLIACAIFLLPGIVATDAYLSSVEENVNYGVEQLISTGGYVLVVLSGTLALTLSYMMGVAFYSTMMYLFGDIYTKENK